MNGFRRNFLSMSGRSRVACTWARANAMAESYGRPSDAIRPPHREISPFSREKLQNQIRSSISPLALINIVWYQRLPVNLSANRVLSASQCSDAQRFPSSAPTQRPFNCRPHLVPLSIGEELAGFVCDVLEVAVGAPSFQKLLLTLFS